MPQVSEIGTGFSQPMEQLEDSSQSLMVSTTSPEEQPPSRALNVIKSNTKGSRDGSSRSRSHSSSSKPPSGRNTSHRGPGSVSSNQHMMQINTADQRSISGSESKSSHFHDQRSVVHRSHDQRLMQVNVGVDPQQVATREAEIMSQAHAAVSEAREQTQRVMSQADSEVRALREVVHDTKSKASSSLQEAQSRVIQAESHAHSVESQAHRLVEEIQKDHQREVLNLQTVANNAYAESQQLLANERDRNQELLQMIESQAHMLESQRKAQDESAMQVSSLQNELVRVRHSSMPSSSQPLEQNGTVNMAEIMQSIEALRKEVKALQKPSRSGGRSPKEINVVAPATFDISSSVAPAPCDAQSWCAGYVSTPSAISPVPGPPSPPSSHSSSSGSRGGGGYHGRKPSPGSGPSPSNGSSPSPFHGSERNPSIGVVSALVNDESSVYKAKDLSLIKIDNVPVDAAHYRSWKNSFLTKASSIDRTGRSVILQWLMQAFDANSTTEMLERTSAELPRLDAHLASLLMEPKHLKGELGLQFQSYTESEQMRGRNPQGRVLLNIIAQRFFLDQTRGANLTQQSLLELDIRKFTHEGLRTFVDRVEFVLNSIPFDLQPSEMTKYTWLYSRMRKVRVMQRHIDRIRDARIDSHCRTWDWLFNKLKILH